MMKKRLSVMFGKKKEKINYRPPGCGYTPSGYVNVEIDGKTERVPVSSVKLVPPRGVSAVLAVNAAQGK
jgi:hypothetical protein